ncbi:alpha/beta hydrolase [Paraburkholderia caffeinilytica]|nr:alpha/beta hydrolase [Paraburkholderia caffeinilytica]
MEFEGVRRVNQKNWHTPDVAEWIAALDAEIERTGDDIVLAAHSLACCMTAKWAAQTKRRIRGALLVAPTDTEALTFPAGTHGFAPMPITKLPFPSIVVMGSADRFISVERGTFLAKMWGSVLVVLPGAGHLGSDNQLGTWPYGIQLLSQLTGSSGPVRKPTHTRE